jgi:hypothetical protein
MGMAAVNTLSASELSSLHEIAKGLLHGAIPEADAVRLVELRLIYRLLGDLRMTTAGRILAVELVPLASQTAWKKPSHLPQ